MKYIFIHICLQTLFNPVSMMQETMEPETLTITTRPTDMGNLEHIAQPVELLNGEKLDKSKSASIGETLIISEYIHAPDFYRWKFILC